MRIVVLDTGPPGMLVMRHGVADADACRAWLDRIVSAGNRVIVPEIADDELRTGIASPGAWPFRLLFTCAEFGLANRIPSANVTSFTRKGWLKRRFLVEYRDESGAVNRLELDVRHPDTFIEALHAGNPDMQISDD